MPGKGTLFVGVDVGGRVADMAENRHPPPEAVRLRALREALEAREPGQWSHYKVADKSGILTRPEVTKAENHGKGLGAARNERAFAQAFDLSRDDFAAYLAGEMSLDDVLRARGRRRSPPATYGTAPKWKEWVAAIRARHPEWEEDSDMWEELRRAEWAFGSIARLTETALEQQAATLFMLRKQDRIAEMRKGGTGNS